MNRRHLLKCFSGVMLLLCCMALLALPLLWVAHTDHCTDTECGTCHHLTAAVKLLSGLMAAGLFALCQPAMCVDAAAALSEAAHCAGLSPVALKVRLND